MPENSFLDSSKPPTGGFFVAIYKQDVTSEISITHTKYQMKDLARLIRLRFSILYFFMYINH
ncbi:hypothetical protein C1Y41_18845 [Pantoea sp. ICBG 1758]|nr:hypothetical protein C1Y41_18845 [Pantoea sp. ICBG 1758]